MVMRRGTSPLGIAIAAAVPLLGTVRLREGLSEVCLRRPKAYQIVFWLLVHLAAFGMFARLSGVISDEGLRSSAHPGLWAAAWRRPAWPCS